MKGAHPKLLAISEEMRQWCALLESELLTWPQVEARAMFGMLAFYRKGRIFCAVPRTRSPEKSNAVIFKLANASPKLVATALAHPNVTTDFMPKAGWMAFQLESVDDVREALGWFSGAYELACKKKARRPR